MVSETEAIEFLAARTKFGIKLGLEKISGLVKFLNNPQTKYPVIHVGGTNGKGSTSAFIASILQEHGLKVGLYTSPHLVYLNERIKINGQPISNKKFCEILEKIKLKSEEQENTFFDVVTAIGFQYFANEKVDIAVIEVGLGGRFDSTNIINPVASVITSIGLDHQQYLGNTISQIAFEKSGIIKPGKKVFIGNLSGEAKEVIEKTAADCNSKLVQINSRETSYLLRNSEVALAAAEFVLDELKILVDRKKLKSGIKSVTKNTGLTGRFHEIQHELSYLILDAAHNPEGIEALIESYSEKYEKQKSVILFGCVGDKDYQQMLKKLRTLSDSILLAVPKLSRGNTIEKLSQTAKNEGFTTTDFETVESAFQFGLEHHGQKPFIICGSFYLLGEIYESLSDRKILKNPFKGLTINQ